jgi:mycofactocin precursor
MIEPTVVEPRVAPVPETDGPAPANPEIRDAEQSGLPLVEADLLVEDVSIDGMCGVY